MRVRRAEADAPSLRCYAEVRYGARSWRCQRRVAARIEATTLGLDIRCVVTSLTSGSPEWLYDALYCARGQAERRLTPERLRSLCNFPYIQKVSL